MEKKCNKGHTFFKTSDCPICENERKPKDSFLSELGAPAKRALENQGILNLEKLATFTEKEILLLHGMGPSSIPKLKLSMKEKQLQFKK